MVQDDLLNNIMFVLLMMKKINVINIHLQQIIDRKKNRSSSSSSSSSEDDEDDLDSIYRQYDIHGNRIKKPNNFGTKISYVDECGLRKNTINPALMKKSTTLTKNNKKPNEGRRKKDCIIS